MRRARTPLTVLKATGPSGAKAESVEVADADYLQIRAEQELGLAHDATHSAVVAPHYAMAERNLDA